MSDFIINFVGLIILALIFLFVAPHACTSQRLTENTLTQAGYSNIQAEGYSWFSCSGDDWYSTKFTAQLNNHLVKGAVCCGLFFKNCTIRYS